MKLLKSLSFLAATAWTSVNALDDQCRSKIKEGSFDGGDTEDPYDYEEQEYSNMSKRLFRNRMTKTANETDYDDESGGRFIMILDSTGSMEVSRNDVISGYNELINQAKSSIPDWKITTITFAQYLKIKNYDSVSDAPNLDPDTYVTKGKTLLQDTLGCTLNHFKNEENNMLAVFSDGMDTHSTIYEEQEIKDLIDELRDHQNWKISITSEENEPGMSKSLKRMGFKRSEITRFSHTRKRGAKSVKGAFKKSGNKLFNKQNNRNKINYNDSKLFN